MAAVVGFFLAPSIGAFPGLLLENGLTQCAKPVRHVQARTTPGTRRRPSGWSWSC